FRGGLRNFETQTDVALTCEMINLGRPHLGKNAAQRRAVGKIAVVKEEPASVNGMVRPEMFDAGAHQIARSPNDAMNDITFLEQQLGQIGAVLPGDASDECALRFRHGRSISEGAGLDKVETNQYPPQPASTSSHP